MTLKQKIDAIIGPNYGNPRGIMGFIAGCFMLYQHKPENDWAISLLNPQPDDQILEIGFGPGRALHQIARKIRTGRATGIDISQTMVAQARIRNPIAIRQGRLTVLAADVMKLPFSDNTFDRILSIHSLYFWPDPHHALSEIYRVLKPGGLCQLTFMPKNRWPSIDPTSQEGFNEYNTQQMLHKANFTEVRLEQFRDKWVSLIAKK